MSTLPPHIREFDDTDATRRNIYDNALGALKRRFPIEDDQYRLELHEPRYDGAQHYGLEQQKRALLTDRKLQTPIKGTWRLIHKPTSTVVEEREDTVMHVPYYTERGTFINNGNEYSIVNQSRLKPGSYVRKQKTGEIETHFNVRPGTGKGFRLQLEPESGIFKVNVGQSSIPIYPLLKAMGVQDKELIKHWGAELTQRNMEAKASQATQKLYSKFAGYAADPAATEQQQQQYLAENLPKFELDADVVARTLGLQNITGVTAPVLMRATQKMLAVSKGEEPEDDRDAPKYSNIYSVEDLIEERIDKDAGKLARSLLFRARRSKGLKSIQRGALDPYVQSLLLGSGLAMPLEETNPLHTLEQINRITKLGAGGISSAESITDAARNVNNGQFGFIDPVTSAEGMNVGIDTRVAYKTFKGRDKQLYAEFRDKNGKTVYWRPEDVDDKVVAFPGELAKQQDTVTAMVNGVIKTVPRDKVDVEVPSYGHMMSALSNMNPMPTAYQPGRAFYGAKFWSQYLPQAKGEVPLVDSLMPDGRLTFSEYYGRRVGSLLSKQAGVVTKVTSTGIHVKGDDGENQHYEIVKDFPFNRLSGVSYTPVVKAGDRVNVGDMVAHSNFTDAKTGAINLGINLKTAVIPARGHSVAGTTSVFWRRPNGTYTYSNIASVPVGDGMRSLALDLDTLQCAELPVHSWQIHAPDSKMLCAVTVDGMQVNATASHSFIGFFGDSIRECTLDELVTTGALVPVIQPKLPFGTGPESITCVSAAGDAKSYDFILDRDFGWVVGMYLAEGCCVYRGDKPHNISFAVTESELVNRLESFFTRHNLYSRSRIRQTSAGTSGSLTVSSAAIAQWFAINCCRYAWYKRLPDCVWTAPIDFAEGLIDGYFCGDGCITSKQCTVTTTSRLLADGLSFLLGAFGVRATYREYRHGVLAKRPAYHLHVFREFLDNFPTLVLTRKNKAIESLKRISVKFSRDRIPIPSIELPIIRKLFNHCLPCDKYVSRALLLHHYDKLPPIIRKLVDAKVWWDYVKTVNDAAPEAYVYDLDMRPLGNFVVGGGWILHNSYEDAYVISESAARKLTTERLYGYDQDSRHGVEIDRNRYMSLFPERFNKKQIELLDHNGVVKVGTTVQQGDPIILATGPKLLTAADAQLGKLHKVLRNAATDKAVEWEHNYPGIVVDSVMTAHGARVNIKSNPPVQVGDKLSTRMGLKGIVGIIMSDDKMPKDIATNEPYEMLLNPMGILSRVAPSQLIEMQLAKIAKKTGQQMRIPQEPPAEGWAQWATKQLEAAGIKEDNDLFDPETGKTIKGVSDGYTYVGAFHHLADKKLSARSEQGGYTLDEQPAKGGKTGAKRFSSMDSVAVLAHGATEVIRDVQLIRGTKNEDYWKAMKLGRPLPEPKTPFVYEKFLNLLRAGGINVQDKGDIVSIMPMMDDDVDVLSKGELAKSDLITANFDPVPGGLFDPGKTGGTQGNRWTHIKLVTPVPNPVMEEPIRRILGLTVKDMRSILQGQKELNGQTGGAALKSALQNIDIDREIAVQQDNVKRLRGSNRDNAVKVLGYLSAAKKQAIHPAKWMVQKVPVLPPIFRPVARMGDMALQADINELYRDLIETNNGIKSLGKDLGPRNMQEELGSLYDAVTAVYGLGDAITPEGQAKRLKGAIRQVIGTSPKTGLFQSKVISKTVDVVGRGVAAPDPNLDMDNIGIPEDSAWTLYKDFVTRRLVRHGYPALKALELIEQRAPEAKDMLDQEMAARPVLLDRAPTWHKFNLLAFYPHISEGNTIRVSPLVTKGFTLDFDGDDILSPVLTNLTDAAIMYLNDTLGNEYLEVRMATRFKSMVPAIESGNIYVFDLEDFPHGDLVAHKEGAKGPIDFYTVGEGVKVLALDELTGKPVWAQVAGWSKHYQREIEVVTLNSGDQYLTDDDPRAVYGIARDGFELKRYTPTEALHQHVHVPRFKRVDISGDSDMLTIKANMPKGMVGDTALPHYMKSSVPLDAITGYILGAMAGDGWVDTNTAFNICGDPSDGVLAVFNTRVQSLFTAPVIPTVRTDEPNEVNGRYGSCTKHRYYTKMGASWLEPLIGKGSQNKHLPPFYLTAPIEFRHGLLAGLMDTDGSASVSNGKRKPQLMCSFSSTSIRMANEVRLLALSLGIRATLTPFRYREDRQAWMITLSTMDIKKWTGIQYMACERKTAVIRNNEVSETSSPAQRLDCVPVPDSLVLILKKALSQHRHEYASDYTHGFTQLGLNTIARSRALRIITHIGDTQKENEIYAAWVKLVYNTDISWDRVVGVQKTGQREDGYDLTVPGYETFMSVDGIVLSNTVNFHVPVSDKAVEQAKSRMLPSKNLFSLTDLRSIRHSPSMEMTMGLYWLTRDPDNTKPVKTFRSIADAKRAYHAGDLKLNDPIKIVS